MMRSRYIIFVVAAMLATSCIEPIVLTPDIAGEITAFEVEGQTRPASISTATRTVGVEVASDADLAALVVTRIGLVETATCEIITGSVLDLSSPRRVAVVTAASYEWTITATKAPVGNPPLSGAGFEEWHRSDRDGTVNPAGRVWNPWPVGGVFGVDRWWDTGNNGVAFLSEGNSTATEPGEGCPANPAGRAAKLETIYASLKAAGGNIYFGKFGGLSTDGSLNATCDIGHPWSAKPRALKGWYKYFPQPIDRVIESYLAIHPYGLSRSEWMGSMDSLHINIALWASPDGENIPFTVDTSPANFVDFRRSTEGIIAYGSMVSGREQAEWAEFNLEMEYLKPEYLAADRPLPANTQLFLQITSSKNCNYFIAGTTGGGPDGTTGSLMYVDELELVY